MLRIETLIILTLLLAACGGTGEDKADGPPVAWWTFDEGEGKTAADASGNLNTAYIRNARWGSGRISGALQMDGGNDGIVTIPLSDSLRSTAQAVTVMGWAYRTAEHNVNLVGHGYPQLFLGFHGPRFKWQLQNSSKEEARCYADPKYRAELDQWFHLAGTYNGRTALLYVNGEQICSDWLWRGGDLVMTEMPFTISGYLDEDGNIIDEITGRVDDVRIYNRALGAGEINAIYEAASKPAF